MSPSPTSLRTYTKPPIDFAAQLQKLKNRGLHVPDDRRALRYLGNISYYRLSGYWPAIIDKTTGRFVPQSSFDDIVRIYRFDKKLRILCMEAIERIEIALRTQIVHHFTISAKDANWYEKTAFFKNGSPYYQQEACKLVESIIGKSSVPLKHRRGELIRAKEKLFIAEYYTNFDSPLHPPAWMALEVLSYGSLSNLFALFVDNAARGRVATHFHVALSVFDSWIKSINHIRNKCAHHERFWDLEMRPINTNTVNPSPYWLSNTNSATTNTTVYYALSLLNFLMTQVSPSSSFTSKVLSIMREHQILDSNWHKQHMGFPNGWSKELMWNTL